jgi:transposase InsO family protein
MLDLIHTDICGQMQTDTPSGNRYFITLIDDHSRYAHVALLKKKSEAFDVLRNFVNMCKTKYGKKPKKFRSDRGGEYIGKNVKNFLRNEGIEWEFTAPYTPEQNGVAERKKQIVGGNGAMYAARLAHASAFLG